MGRLWSGRSRTDVVDREIPWKSKRSIAPLFLYLHISLFYTPWTESIVATSSVGDLIVTSLSIDIGWLFESFGRAVKEDTTRSPLRTCKPAFLHRQLQSKHRTVSQLLNCVPIRKNGSMAWSSVMFTLGDCTKRPGPTLTSMKICDTIPYIAVSFVDLDTLA